jgi:CxxC-x17-CxxC domain-containing protein
MFEDKQLTCQDCGQSFTWTASEQEFFNSKGFSQPVRCQACRQKRKAEKQGGGGDSRQREMYTITCAQCGNEGQVPFKPLKPETVLCADCFRKQKDNERGINA